MSAPKRIQRKRTKGWRMPPDAVYVGRPSRWGNPFVVGQVKSLIGDDDSRLFILPCNAQEAVDHFRWYVEHHDERHDLVRRELAGRDLACWCPLSAPCHADVLLELANR